MNQSSQAIGKTDSHATVYWSADLPIGSPRIQLFNEPIRRSALQSRRDFLATTSLAITGAALTGCATTGVVEPIIDIHQHTNYSDRPDDILLKHQRLMGVTTTILLPSGKPISRPSSDITLSI
jgi:hypothetical protein